MKIAIVHDWLTSRGGAERFVHDLHRIWPAAPIYTSAFDADRFPEFESADVRTMWIDKLPLAHRKHQLFSIPRSWAFRALDLSAFDVVLSSSSAESKYIRTGDRTLHICYCHRPIRYYWHGYDWFREHPPFGALNPLVKRVFPLVVDRLRKQDYRLAQGVDVYVAPSEYVRAQIETYYGRESTVVPYATDVALFGSAVRKPGDYYLIAGRQVAYKRLDLAIDAFNELGCPLVVAGIGEEIARLRPLAKANIEFRGHVTDRDLPRLYAEARALVHPQEEDFGMAAVEAQAAGTPVIAYGVGGASETVVDGRTGLFFFEQTADGLIAAIRRFEGMQFDPDSARANARRFAPEVFDAKMTEIVEREYRRFVA